MGDEAWYSSSRSGYEANLRRRHQVTPPMLSVSSDQKMQGVGSGTDALN